MQAPWQMDDAQINMLEYGVCECELLNRPALLYKDDASIRQVPVQQQLGGF